MGRVSGSSSLISRLVGSLPRHELVGVVVVGAGVLTFVVGACRNVGDLPRVLSAECSACVALADVAHE